MDSGVVSADYLSFRKNAQYYKSVVDIFDEMKWIRQKITEDPFKINFHAKLFSIIDLFVVNCQEG
jgi:hypothetical protein